MCGGARLKARPHPNARRHLDQLYKQIWKDVVKHRVLVVPSDHPAMDDVLSSPFNAVDKMLPDRTIAVDKRIVHDQRGVNALTDKELHPPAIQLKHEQIARLVLWNKARAPKVPILMSKKDIAGAFRLLWVDQGTRLCLQATSRGTRTAWSQVGSWMVPK